MNQELSYRLFGFVAILYTFFNGWLLPEGLYFTTLLTPFFFINLVRVKGLKYYGWFLLATFLMACLQLPTVDHFKDYAISFILLQTLGIFVINAYLYLQTAPPLEHLFKQLTSINLVLVVMALFFLLIPFLKPTVWYLLPISPDVPVVPRLKLFTYEASYYSLVMLPIATYYALKKMLLQSKYNILFVSLSISLLLSFSLGVIATAIICTALLLTLNLNALRARMNLGFLMLAAWCLVGGGVALFFFYRHNPLFGRLENIYVGKDTSARGRLSDSFYIAWEVARMRSRYIGIGLGQLKYLGKDFSNYFYAYSHIPTTRIHNSLAETFCYYGWVGIALRTGGIAYGFIKTKVWNNYYRSFLFLFVFIYQFTGSYLFNPAEYVLWMLAFTPALFPQFNKTAPL